MCVYADPHPYQHTSASPKFKDDASADSLAKTVICDELFIHRAGLTGL